MIVSTPSLRYTCVDDAARFSAPADVDCQKALIVSSLTSSSTCLGGGGGEGAL